ncbi:hypothetical protein HPP92_001544 [Vanilla planifolia]|uniref:Uncharacterized protein n=1 Tax=Vanilla planifolia TaxID=51239 RepID=A0A835VJS2_VANPL|nr:hypothetical protein HPP92_001544 [Vanilla planifolia]
MGHHCCSKQKVKRGLWSPEEDEKLIKFINTHGHGCWSSVPKQAGLQRCGKSCRLRWINYLRPDLKRGSFTEQEERIIIDVHRILGNRWAQIAKHLPGRTDNEVKNFWNSCIKKKLMAQGLDPKTHNLIPNSRPPSHTNITSNLPHFPPFTISSTTKGTEAQTTSGSALALHDSMPISSFQYPEPSLAYMGFNEQASQEYNGDFMVDACIWASPIEPLADEPKQNGAMENKSDFSLVDGDKAIHEVEPSYGNQAFDIELMESELIPSGGSMFCSSSSMDQLQWEC